MGRELFLRECLCIWTPEPDSGSDGPISPAQWSTLIDGTSKVDASTARVAADLGGDWHVAGVAGSRPDDLCHVGVLVSHKSEATFVTELRTACDAMGVNTITLPKGSPGESLAKPLAAAGFDIDSMSQSDQALATSELIKASTGTAPPIRHRGDPSIVKALEIARTKPYGNGGQVWSRRTMGDIAALTTVSMAHSRIGGDPEPDPELQIF